MPECVERLPAVVYEDAQREQRGSADPLLAMDKDLVTAAEPLPNEHDSLLQIGVRSWLQIGRRQMEQRNPGIPQSRLVVASLGAKVDDRCDSVRLSQIARPIHREARTEGNLISQPVKVRNPCFRDTSIIFFFNRHDIFFFIINSHGCNLC